MPRKAPGCCGGRDRGRRFNEAGAVMPRKLSQLSLRLLGPGASMRPGLLCPGSWPASAGGWSGRALQ